MFAIDHLAFPCFDLPATRRFYTELLGATMCHAQSGPAVEWNAKEYLLVAFELPGGVTIDFFTFDGICRPESDCLPIDIRHVALTVPTRAHVKRFGERFASASVPFWTERHNLDDLHVYATDPNGVTIELVAAEDGIRAREHDAEGAQQIVGRWAAARG